MKARNSSIAVLITATLLILPLLSIGCANVILHPISQQDIVQVKKGSSYTPDRDGYFLSNDYVKNVMQAKVDSINLK